MTTENSNGQNPVAELDMHEQMRIRLAKLEELTAQGRDPFETVTYDVTATSAQILSDFDKLEGQDVSLAGRIMSKRGMGKVSFCDLVDRSGKIQLFTKIDALGEAAYEQWQTLDIGDLVGVRGVVFRTQRGEISVKTSEYTLLAIPPPPAGKIPRTERYRHPLSSALSGPDCQSGGQGCFF